ncbi:MAG: MFS transporter [Collinsella sp.]|nr:MFS transporter [Collinsella sp.]
MAYDVSDHPAAPYRWVILFLASFQIFAINYLQFQVSPLAHELIPIYDLDAGRIASLLFAPLLSGVLLSIPGGMACDRIGPRVTVGVAAMVSALAGFYRVNADSYGMLFCTMFISGACPAVLQAASLKVFHVWFKGQSNLAMGLFFASASLGGALAQATSNLFPDVWSAFSFSAFMFATSAVGWVLFSRDLPPGYEAPKSEANLAHIVHAAGSIKVWLVAASVGLGMATSTAYMELLPQAYIETWHIDAETAGMMAAVLALGSIVGSMLAAPLHAVFKHLKALLIGMICMGFLLKILSWTSFGSLGLWPILFANGIFGAAAGPLLEALPVQFPEIGEEYAGSAGGIIGSASLACSYFLPVCISTLSASNYGFNMIAESVFFLLSAIPILFLKLDG